MPTYWTSESINRNQLIKVSLMNRWEFMKTQLRTSRVFKWTTSYVVSAHCSKHSAWKVWLHRIVSTPSSIRSKHTAHVGSSVMFSAGRLPPASSRTLKIKLLKNPRFKNEINPFSSSSSHPALFLRHVYGYYCRNINLTTVKRIERKEKVSKK